MWPVAAPSRLCVRPRPRPRRARSSPARLAPQDPHFKPALYIWRAVPPGGQFVSLGMVATTSDEPPPLTAISCLPRRWCQYETDEPRALWSNSGQGSRAGSFYTTGPQLACLVAMQTQDEPPSDMRMRCQSERWFARADQVSDLVELAQDDASEGGRGSVRVASPPA